MCETQKRLLASYQLAMDRYTSAVGALRSEIGTSQRSEYDRLREECETARKRLEEARSILVSHMESHGCY